MEEANSWMSLENVWAACFLFHSSLMLQIHTDVILYIYKKPQACARRHTQIPQAGSDAERRKLYWRWAGKKGASYPRGKTEPEERGNREVSRWKRWKE